MIKRCKILSLALFAAICCSPVCTLSAMEKSEEPKKSEIGCTEKSKGCKGSACSKKSPCKSCTTCPNKSEKKEPHEKKSLLERWFGRSEKGVRDRQKHESARHKKNWWNVWGSGAPDKDLKKRVEGEQQEKPSVSPQEKSLARARDKQKDRSDKKRDEKNHDKKIKNDFRKQERERRERERQKVREEKKQEREAKRIKAREEREKKRAEKKNAKKDEKKHGKKKEKIKKIRNRHKKRKEEKENDKAAKAPEMK